jgi:hypothetical protein
VFLETFCPLLTLVFGGGRVPTSDPPAPASRFPPLGGADAPMVLPIPLAVGAAAAVAAEEATSTMVVGLPDIASASQSKTMVSGVSANVDSRAKGGSLFICVHV